MLSVLSCLFQALFIGFALQALFVQGECIKSEKIYSEMPGANNTLRLYYFRLNGLLRSTYKSDPETFRFRFVPGNSFNVVMKYQYDNTIYNIDEPAIEYNDTTLSASMELTTVSDSSGMSSVRMNSLLSSTLSTLLSSYALSEVTNIGKFEALASAGMIAAAISTMPLGYANAAEEACPLSFDITLTFIPGRWKSRKQNFRDKKVPRGNGKEEEIGEIEFTPDE